jgi:hypothetical protein
MGEKVKERIIPEAEYLARLEQGVPVGNCWVDMGNGQLAYALQEVVVVGVPFNKYGDKFYDIHAVNFCVADNTRIDIQQRDAQISAANSSMEYDRKKRDVKERLYKAVSAYFSKEKAKSFGIGPEYQAKVRELEVKETLLLLAITQDRDISYSAFPYDFYIQNQQLVDDYFQLMKLPEKTDDEGVGFWESLIPVWGSAKEAEYNFDKGHYVVGIIYALLAITDVFLVKSIVTGIAKGAFKVGGSHSWRASRRWALKHDWTGKGEPLHHWLIQQSVAKKYGIEAFTNQPWNWVRFESQSSHMRFGHGFKFGEEAAGSLGQRFWYGTPHWFKIGATDVGGHVIMNSIDED